MAALRTCQHRMSPQLGLIGHIWTSVKSRRSSRQCMASGIRKIISACSYVRFSMLQFAQKTDGENPRPGTGSKLGTAKQLFSLALGPLWRSHQQNFQWQIWHVSTQELAEQGQTLFRPNVPCRGIVTETIDFRSLRSLSRGRSTSEQYKSF